MGSVRIQVELANTASPSKRASVEALVDSGAMVNWLPETVVNELGLETIGSLEVEYADGRRESRPVCGPITLRMDGRSAITDAVSGPPGTEALVSVVMLGRLDLLIDPVEQRVKPRHPESPGPVLGVK